MKIKKNILNSKNLAKILAFGVLFSSVPVDTFAGVLSDDERFEIFEGNSLKMDDILEEDNVDVEIEGNTMVNLVPSESKYEAFFPDDQNT